MKTPIRQDLSAWRNQSPYRQRFYIFEDDGVTPLDMTLYRVRAQIRLSRGAGGAALIDLDSTDLVGTRALVDELGFELVILYDDLQTLPTATENGGEQGEAVSLEYDIHVEEPGGEGGPWYYGAWTLNEQVTVL